MVDLEESKAVQVQQAGYIKVIDSQQRDLKDRAEKAAA